MKEPLMLRADQLKLDDVVAVFDEDGPPRRAPQV